MPFSDPIIAGETLVRQAMQSEGFVSTVSGWRIERDGDAEFNSIALRGFVHVGDNDVYIEVVTFAGQPVIVLQGSNGLQYRIQVNTSNKLVINENDEINGQRIIIDRANGAIYFHSSINSKVVLFDKNTGFLNTGTGTVTKETWHDVTYQNSWSNFGGSFSNVQYRIGTEGRVHLRGAAKPGTLTNGTTLFTLPAGYRPPATKRFYGFHNATAHTGLYDIGSAGAVTINGMTGATIVMFDGVSFETINT